MKCPSIAGWWSALIGLTFALAACGSNGGAPDSGSTDEDGGYDGGPPTATFSGPFDGSMPLFVTAQIFDVTNDAGVAVDSGSVIAYYGGATLNGYSVSISGATDIAGPYDAGIYAANNPIVTGLSFTVTANPADGGSYGTWGAGYSAATESTPVGSLSTVITDTGPATGRLYSASHGSFTATLVDDVSDGGPLTVTGSF